MECSIINIFCILCIISAVYSTGVESEKPNFVPSNYTLRIKTAKEHFKDGDTSKMKYEGTVIVEFDKKPADFKDDFQIELNTNPKMEIVELGLSGKKSDNYEEIKSCKYELKEDKLLINCTKDVTHSAFKLEVQYKNPFGNDMSGFYRSSYKDSENKTRWLLTTHFEPVDARNAFPCFDKPDLKAKFQIEITVPKEIKTVLSNTMKSATKIFTDDADFTTHVFKQTDIPMSTYLVAFTASDFESTEAVEFKSDYLKDKYPKRYLRTYGRKDIIDKKFGDFAQKVGYEALNKLTEYLKIGYAFEKVDLVGIPDFGAGAMENWGHVSFRERALFVDEKNTPTINKQGNVLTITHELVHQWFGNLVTLKTWDYIWLNEAFANYLEYKMSAEFSFTKTWQLMNQMLVKEVHLRAFETDGFNSSFPLNNKITDESAVAATFNDIPYAKGSAVLRMWDIELKDKFQTSLQKYLDARKENSAVPSDLYKAFKENAGMNEQSFKTWTDQAGYPVVEVKKKNDTLVLTQSRFFWDKMNSGEIWRIPITLSTNSSKEFETSPKDWLEEKSKEIKIDKDVEWFIINNQQAGYYRVSYEEGNWVALSKALLEKDNSGIPELNRAQIVNDIFSLARSIQKNYVTYSTALSLAKYLEKDNSYIVWKTALSAFDFVQTKIYKENVYDKFKDYVLSLIKPHYKGLNLTALEHVEMLKNVEISRWACSLDFGPCVDQANSLYKDSSYKKFPDTQEIVLCTVIRNDEKVWDSVFDKYKSEENSVLKVMYISALGCTKKASQAKAFLNKILAENSDIRKQDISYVLSSVYKGNLKNVDVVFDFIKENYKKFFAEFGGINTLGEALIGVAKKLTTKAQVENLEKLADEIEKSPEGKGTIDSLRSAKRIARSNLDWLDNKASQIRTYFNSGSFVTYSLTLLLFCLISVFHF